MAHVIKDSMNHYAIEVKRGPKHVQCIIRLNGEVEFKQYPLTKMITDHEYAADSGEYQFDKRWERVLHGDPNTPDPRHERLIAELKDLHRVIDSFLSGLLPVTDKAQRLLERLRMDPTATSAPQLTDEEDTQMATKTKTKKEKKEKVPKEKKVTIAATICAALGEGMDAESILAKVKKAFPNANTTKNSIAFYRTKLRAAR